MRLIARFRVRSMMAIVVVVALGFGLAFEWKNRADRVNLLRKSATLLRDASIHRMRALECQNASKRKLLYRPAERVKPWAADGVRGFPPVNGFRSWDEEMENHCYWGDRFYDQADSWDQKLSAIESRLLLP